MPYNYFELMSVFRAPLIKQAVHPIQLLSQNDVAALDAAAIANNPQYQFPLLVVLCAASTE